MALINTTTSGVLGTTIYGDGAGALTIQQDGVQVAKVTRNPTFSAFANSGLSLSNNVFTKVVFQTERYDTNNCYDPSTSKFTPTVAGYYLINAIITPGSGTWTAGSLLQCQILKNGVTMWNSEVMPAATNGNWMSSTASTIVYFNGTTDYAEIWAQAVGTGISLVGFGGYTEFQATLVRPD